MPLLEDPLFDLKTYFDDNLATFIAAVNAQVTSNKISDMRDIEVGRFTALHASSYPVMNIIPGPSPIEALSQGFDEMRMEPAIYIADRVSDSEASYLKLLRYADAVRDSLLDDTTGGDAFDYITVSEIAPYPSDANSIAVVVIRCETLLQVSRS